MKGLEVLAETDQVLLFIKNEVLGRVDEMLVDIFSLYY